MTTMKASDPLAALATAELGPKAAAVVVRQYLTAEPKGGDRVYRALRSWCWSALTERRYDDDLRLWHDLLRKTSAALAASRQKAVAERLVALSDLVYESIQFAEHEPVWNQLSRTHVRTILVHLARNGEHEKRQLMDLTGVKQANLSRVMGGLISAGLVDRQSRGRSAVFRITQRGTEACVTLARSSPAKGALTETQCQIAAQKPKWATVHYADEEGMTVLRGKSRTTVRALDRPGTIRTAVIYRTGLPGSFGEMAAMGSIIDYQGGDGRTFLLDVESYTAKPGRVQQVAKLEPAQPSPRSNLTPLPSLAYHPREEQSLV